jgi:hypothetical protein
MISRLGKKSVDMRLKDEDFEVYGYAKRKDGETGEMIVVRDIHTYTNDEVEELTRRNLGAKKFNQELKKRQNQLEKKRKQLIEKRVEKELGIVPEKKKRKYNKKGSKQKANDVDDIDLFDD